MLFLSITGIFAWLKWKKSDENYKPFLAILMVGAVTEIINFLCGRIFQNNRPSTNIYVLVAALLWLFQFSKWNTFGKYPRISIYLAISIILAWIWNLFYVDGILNLLIHYRVYSSFILVILSVHQLNYYIVHYKGDLFKSSIFLICVGLLIQFTLKILTECFYLINTSGAHLTSWVGMIFSTLLYIVAMYYLPQKKIRSGHS